MCVSCGRANASCTLDESSSAGYPLKPLGNSLIKCQSCGSLHHNGLCHAKHKQLCNAYSSVKFRKSYTPSGRSSVTDPALDHLIKMVHLLALLSKNVHVNDQLRYLVSHQELFGKERINIFDNAIKHCLADPKLVNATNPHMSPKTLVWLACVHAINSFTWQDCHLNNMGTAFDFLVALVNHSCSPNCHLYIDSKGQTVLRALRSILPDEAITVSYTRPLQSFLERSQVLRHYYFFTCVCPTCSGKIVIPWDAWFCVNCNKYVYFDQRCSSCSKCIRRDESELITIKALLDPDSVTISTRIPVSVSTGGNPGLRSDVTKPDDYTDRQIKLHIKVLKMLESCGYLPLANELYYHSLLVLQRLYANLNLLDCELLVSFTVLQSTVEAEALNRYASPLVCSALLDTLGVGVNLLADTVLLVPRSLFLRSVLSLCLSSYSFLETYSRRVYDFDFLESFQDCGIGLNQLADIVSDLPSLPDALSNIALRFAAHHYLQPFSIVPLHQFFLVNELV